MEFIVLLLFILTLIGSIVSGIPLLAALAVGYVIFFAYGLLKKHTISEVLKMSLKGIMTTKNILLLFLMIGALTASWRSSGTIAAILYYSIRLIRPSIMLLMSFLLNSLVSFLTGTSFGTSATMGVICMTMSLSMGINPVLSGGAILSGAYFGDRCSPVSTSALLVSNVTGTNIFSNIKSMFRTAFIPFLITCAVYLFAGILGPHTASGTEIGSLFSENFTLGFFPLLPAIVIFTLAILKTPVKKAMILSLIVSVLVDLFCQHTALLTIIRTILMGYHAADPSLAKMLDGGGIISMARVTAIVCLSSSFSGIFEGTGLLLPIKEQIAKLREHTSVYGCVFLTSIASSLIACNQTLSIILTNQLCGFLTNDQDEMAINLENTAVVIAPLVPWCIAGAVPLSTIGAPMLSLAAACYLYLIPLWNLITSHKKH